MGFEAWLTVAVVAGIFGLLMTDRFSAELVVLGGLVVLLVAGVLKPAEAFAGFANPGVVSLAGLYLISAGLRDTGALDRPAQWLLSRTESITSARRRLTVVATGVSAFINNTPLVALLMPVASAWARRRGLSNRGLLLPLSYATILGGTCTLIGTSVHLVTHGLLLDRGLPGLGFFELTPIGVPLVVVCLPVMWWLARRLLDAPQGDAQKAEAERREYTADLTVTPDAPFLGQSVEAAGLRHLPGLFLVRLQRGERVVAPVGPDEVLLAGDLLTFAGVLDTIVDLQRRRGFAPPQVRHATEEWMLHEAVVSGHSQLEGRGIREVGFRTLFGAAVVAVHRRGERIEERIGNIVLRHGDTLLLLAPPGFAAAFRDSNDFYLVSEVPDTTRPRHRRAPIALAVLLAVILLNAFQIMPLVSAAAAGAVVIVLTGCLSPGQAHRAIDASVLAVVAGSLGIARALEQTGVARTFAEALLSFAGDVGPIFLLAAVYLSGTLLTELITNAAAAALLLPIALAVADAAHLDARPFILAATTACAVSLATPIGYQTNMMVFGPGGYRFIDFVKMGVALQLLAAAVAIPTLSLLYGLW